MGAKSSPRNGTRPTIVGIHTNEGPNPSGDEGRDRSAENLCAWMDGQQVSYHKVIDDDSVVHYVADDRYAWAMRSANRRSLNLCFIGRASFDRAEWLRHERMLRMGASEVRSWCDRWGIPRQKLTAAQVGRDERGICGHVDWTNGKRDGTHTDPGAGFPWDVFIAYVNGMPAPAGGAGPVATGRPVLKVGDTGPVVGSLQAFANRVFASYAGIPVLAPPLFGPKTLAFVREFQTRSRLLVDGIVGPRTWSALEQHGYR